MVQSPPPLTDLVFYYDKQQRDDLQITTVSAEQVDRRASLPKLSVGAAR